jgi:hypothetical protein
MQIVNPVLHCGVSIFKGIDIYDISRFEDIGKRFDLSIYDGILEF